MESRRWFVSGIILVVSGVFFLLYFSFQLQGEEWKEMSNGTVYTILSFLVACAGVVAMFEGVMPERYNIGRTRAFFGKVCAIIAGTGFIWSFVYVPLSHLNPMNLFFGGLISIIVAGVAVFLLMPSDTRGGVSVGKTDR